MGYHILMPFGSEKNKNKILSNLRRFDVTLHPIIDSSVKFPKLNWIQLFNFTSSGNNLSSIYYNALNKFMEKVKISDKDYYMFLSDTDYLEPSFFKKLKEINTDFIVVSLKRKNDRPFISSWRNMGRQGMSGKQLIVRGKYLKEEGFGGAQVASVKFASKLWKKYPHGDFTFAPNAYIWATS